LKEVENAHVVTGLHDIIALVNADSTKHLADEIVNKIQKSMASREQLPV